MGTDTGTGEATPRNERAKDLKTRSPPRRAGAQETIPLVVLDSRAFDQKHLGWMLRLSLCASLSYQVREAERGGWGPVLSHSTATIPEPATPA